MIFQRENETWRLEVFTFILLLYGLRLTTCFGKNLTEFDILTTEANDTFIQHGVPFVADRRRVLPDTVRDVNIMKWLDQKAPETIPKVSLAFLPGLAILCFLVALCFKCCGWFREHVKDRHMDEDNDYMIVTQDDGDFMDVDFRSDTASTIYYDTITSYYSFMHHSKTYDTMASYRSLNSKYDKRYNTENTSRSFLQKVTEQKDQGVQVDVAGGEGRLFQNTNQTRNVHSKRFGRFEVEPSKITFENETTDPHQLIKKKPMPTSGEHLMRYFSLSARSTPMSIRRLRKFKVSFNMDGKEEQYNTLPARPTFVVAVDVEPSPNRMIKSRETIPPCPHETADKMGSATTTTFHPVQEQHRASNAKPLSTTKKENPDDERITSLQASSISNDVYANDLERVNNRNYSQELENIENNKTKTASTNIPRSLCGLYQRKNVGTHTHNADKSNVDDDSEDNQPTIQEFAYHKGPVEKPIFTASMTNSEHSLYGKLANDSGLKGKCDVALRDEPYIDPLTDGLDGNSSNRSTSNVPAKYISKQLEESSYYSSSPLCSDSSVLIENGLHETKRCEEKLNDSHIISIDYPTVSE